MVRERRYYQLYFALLAKYTQELPLGSVDFSSLLKLFEQGLQLEKSVREICAFEFAHSRESPMSCEYFAAKLADEFRKRPHVLAKALAGLFQISLSDRRISRACDQELEQIAHIFGFTRKDYREIRAHFVTGELSTEVQKAPAEPTNSELELLEILGCTADASFVEIRRAYRQLALNNHPDVYASLSMDAVVRAELAENFKRIQAAYLRLKELRRLE